MEVKAEGGGRGKRTKMERGGQERLEMSMAAPGWIYTCTTTAASETGGRRRRTRRKKERRKGEHAREKERTRTGASRDLEGRRRK